jgi:hypothetical protein
MSNVLAGVEHDLKRMPVEFRQSGAAELARAMAERIDEGKGSPSECGKVALEALAKLREMAPEEVAADGIDDLAKARRRRRKTA